MSAGRLTAIHVFPAKGEPGRELDEAILEPEGLVGDRRKRAPLSMVAAEDVDGETRSNLVVDLRSADLQTAVGAGLRVGHVELELTSPAGSCPGVYAAVRHPGTVRVGDAVEVLHRT